jgi:hypothetical protein
LGWRYPKSTNLRESEGDLRNFKNPNRSDGRFFPVCGGTVGFLTPPDRFATLRALRMGVSRHFGLLTLLAVTGGSASFRAGAQTAIEAGPFAHQFPRTLIPGTRVEAAGPLLSYDLDADTQGWALHPFVSFQATPTLERSTFSILYPIFTGSRIGSDYRWQFFQLLSWSGGEHVAGDQARRTTVFPFYFSQKSTAGTNDYRALLPIYGHIQNRLFRDEIDFALLPLWVRTRKRDVVTDNYLVPFFHRRHGAAQGWQFWPLYGRETRAPLTRTNAITDEPEIVPGHEKQFALWPIFFRERLGLGGPNPTTNLTVLPILSLTRSPELDRSVYLWPFFTHTENRAGRFEEWGAPWPFIGWADGEGKHARRFWPVWGRASSPELSSDFLLWPLYTHKHLVTDALDRETTRGLLYIWRDIREQNRATGVEARRRYLWPLFAHTRDLEGRERLQVLAPIENIFPGNQGIARDWSPVWSLFRAEHNPATGHRSESLLWNLWRRDRLPDLRRTSLLFGAVRTQKTAGTRQWRVFGIGPSFPALDPKPLPAGTTKNPAVRAPLRSARGDVVWHSHTPTRTRTRGT